MKKIRGEKQKEEFRVLLEEAAKHCTSMLQAYQLTAAQWQQKHENKAKRINN